jgi:hypothetical protein
MALRDRYSMVAAAIVALLLFMQPVRAVDQAAREREFQKSIRPLLAKYCYECHGSDSPEADLGLVNYDSAKKILVGRQKWQRVAQHLAAGSMPPPETTQPTTKERELLTAFVTSTLNDIDCVRSPNPGRVTLRRLNRTEYRNTVQDLLGVDYEPASNFPADDVGYGFDNIGDVLSLPPLLMEKYLTAAEEISQKAIAIRPPFLAIEKRVYGSNLEGNNGKAGATGGILVSKGDMASTMQVEEPGLYELTISAEGDQAGPEPVKMTVLLDGKEIERFNVKAVRGKPKEFTIKRRLKPGGRKIGVGFLNDFYNKQLPDGKQDRNLIVNFIEVRGPIDAKPKSLPESHKRIFIAMPDGQTSTKQAAERVLRRLASRAFRRPATNEEVARFVGLAESAIQEGDSFEESIQYAMQAILCSPHFLFKVEIDPRPSSDADKPGPVGDFELAVRLAYFLWSSMPDDTLLQLGRKNGLRNPEELTRQVERMIADERSSALTRNFAGQWLELRSLDIRTPDVSTYPSYKTSLKRSMRIETEMFFEAIMRENRSLLDLIDADFTFVDEGLAKLYDLSPPSKPGFQRVSLSGTDRGGILTHASVLTITSNPTRTSPVKRGKWILQNLLNDPPPPAPPNVPELANGEKGPLTGTLRQRMEQHRVNPACASCHQRMDPLGFALENFDGVGSWRTIDGKDPIDPSGELPTGEKVSGPRELKKLIISKKKEQFVRCVAEKMLTYALGRGLEYYDKCAVDKIVTAVEKDGYKFNTLVREIVLSEPFHKRGTAEQ